MQIITEILSSRLGCLEFDHLTALMLALCYCSCAGSLDADESLLATFAPCASLGRDRQSPAASIIEARPARHYLRVELRVFSRLNLAAKDGPALPKHRSWPVWQCLAKRRRFPTASRTDKAASNALGCSINKYVASVAIERFRRRNRHGTIVALSKEGQHASSLARDL